MCLAVLRIPYMALGKFEAARSDSSGAGVKRSWMAVRQAASGTACEGAAHVVADKIDISELIPSDALQGHIDVARLR